MTLHPFRNEASVIDIAAALSTPTNGLNERPEKPAFNWTLKRRRRLEFFFLFSHAAIKTAGPVSIQFSPASKCIDPGQFITAFPNNPPPLGLPQAPIPHPQRPVFLFNCSCNWSGIHVCKFFFSWGNLILFIIKAKRLDDLFLWLVLAISARRSGRVLSWAPGFIRSVRLPRESRSFW